MEFSKWKISVLIMAIVGQVSATREPGRGTGASNLGSSAVSYGTGGMTSTTFRGGSSVLPGVGSIYTPRGSTSSRGYSGGSSGGFGQNLQEVLQPYNFNYKSDDEQGNSHYHKAETDASGTVRGSYGYYDIYGLYRVVEYLADGSGFRASIQTNEPGTDDKKNPADVQIIAEKPPAFTQDRHTQFTRTGAPKVGSGVETVILESFNSTLP